MPHEPISIPGVADKRVAPPGILPRHLPAWVLGGLALLMVLVIVFSGGSSPQPKTPQSAPGVQAPILQPSQEKLLEYQQRIEEQTRKLVDEQVDEQKELERTKNALTGGAAQSRRLPGSGGPGGYSPVSPPRDFEAPPEPPEKRWIEEEKAKREYQSLFAPNLVLSHRNQPKPGESDTSAALSQAAPPIDPRLYLLPPWPPQAAPAPQLPPAGAGLPEAPKPAATAVPASKAQNKLQNNEGNRATGNGYRLFEGTLIETVLTNRLDSSFSGPVNCLVSYDVYSHDRRHVLIPKGSRVLGSVHPVDSAGQQRLAVTFHRLIMPDGYSVSLDQFQGLSQVGETGLRDKGNHHYLQIFGASIAIGLIGGLAQSTTRYGTDVSGVEVYQQGVANSLGQSSMRILDRFLNVLPTFTIREGQRIKIYLAEDLNLPAYENHEMPADL